jgi:hypothetical protein
MSTAIWLRAAAGPRDASSDGTPSELAMLLDAGSTDAGSLDMFSSSKYRRFSSA